MSLMSALNDKITKNLEKLASMYRLNEHELQSCINKVKQLAPNEQQKYLNVLANIQAQLQPVHVDQLNKVRDVLGAQQHSGPALSSHIDVCLRQNQLIANTLTQTKALIDQAYSNSLNDPTRRSKIIHQNMINDMEQANQLDPNNPQQGAQNQQRNTPRPTVPGGNTLRSEALRENQQSLANGTNRAANVPLNTPLRSEFAVLRPEMRLLAKMLRIKQENKKEENISHELREDAYVDSEILRTDRSVDEKIFETSEQTNKKLQKILHETTQMELEEDNYMSKTIAKRSLDLNQNFDEHQKTIEKELSLLQQSSHTPQSAPEPSAPQLPNR